MHGRCTILATLVRDANVKHYRCPSSMHQFHYHGHDPKGIYHLLVGGSPCDHRHKTADAAQTCTTSKA